MISVVLLCFIKLLLYYLLSFLAYTGFYLFYDGKPYGEKPPSTTGYDYVRVFTCFCVNSQRICVSKALAKTRGGDLLPIETLQLLSPRETLRVSSSSSGFLLPSIAYRATLSVIDSIGLYTSLFIVPNRIYT